MSYVLSFLLGAVVAMVLMHSYFGRMARKERKDECESHARFPKSWSSNLERYYYKQQSEAFLNFLKEKGWNRRNMDVVTRIDHATDDDIFRVFEFFRLANRLGLKVTVSELNKDGEDLEEDPELAVIELQRMYNQLYPSFVI